MKSNPTPTKTENDAVAKFIGERIVLLGKDNGSARDELVNGSVSGSVQNPATTTYLANYATTLNREALPLLAKEKDVRVRLNLAIVVAKVAASAQNAWLAPTVEKLLAPDSKEAVVLWGLKAAAAVLPQPGSRIDLLKVVLDTVKAHSTSGPIADEAYLALQPSTAVPPTPATIKCMQDMYDLRVKAYSAGVPTEPAVDRLPSVSLTAGGATGMWTLSTPAQQKRTIQLIVELLSSAAKQADAVGAGDQHDQLVFLIKGTSNAVQALGSTTSNTGLSAVGRSVSQLPSNATNLVAGVQPEVDELRKAFQLPPK